MATLHDLRSKYSYEDALNLYEALLVHRENQRRDLERQKRESANHGRH